MRKSIKLLCSTAVAAVFLSASPASATEGTPVYQTFFYSDSTYQEEVGHLIWTGCNRWGQPTYQLYGTYTYYQQDVLVGYCGGEP